MLRSRGISQICHTYSEDMHPIYPPLPWLHTPRLRLGVTTVAEDIWVHILLLGVVYPIRNGTVHVCKFINTNLMIVMQVSHVHPTHSVHSACTLTGESVSALLSGTGDVRCEETEREPLSLQGSGEVGMVSEGVCPRADKTGTKHYLLGGGGQTQTLPAIIFKQNVHVKQCSHEIWYETSTLDMASYNTEH